MTLLKKAVSVGMAAILALSLAACGTPDPTDSPDSGAQRNSASPSNPSAPSSSSGVNSPEPGTPSSGQDTDSPYPSDDSPIPGTPSQDPSAASPSPDVSSQGPSAVPPDPSRSSPPSPSPSAVPNEPKPFRDITAAQLVSEIKIGWNLGNSFEATDFGEGRLPANSTVQTMETFWSNPATTRANIDAVKAAGFNAIRIPVSWFNAANGAPDYIIRSDWMERVAEVVDYAVANDMYVLLDTHHDEYHGHGTDRDVLRFEGTEAQITASLNAYRKIWEQIADRFKNYNEKLIFEGLNEPRVPNSAQEWSGGTDAQRAALNRYYPVFVEVVRNSGGNNGKRVLMISTYAASATATAVNGLTLPRDSVANKLVVSIHAYAPYTFCYDPKPGSVSTWSTANAADIKGVQDALGPAYDKFISKGIPVIIGEFGAVHKNNTNARAAWVEYYVSYAKSLGFRCFIWDNGVTSADYEGAELFGFFNRRTNRFAFTEVIDALIRGANSTSPSPSPSPSSSPSPSPSPSPSDSPPSGAVNLGKYSYGYKEDGVTTNTQQAVWNLTAAQVTAAKETGAKLALKLSKAPSATLQLVWQGPANSLWWNQKDILDSTGNVISPGEAAWNPSTNTLTINLSAAADYSVFKNQPELNLIIAYYGGNSVDDLGIVSADLIK
ncbi:MAG: cellulase family glycosylhydrolase [Oscillospiraceae bacterium]|nr:cellulase family glycosylhydrolase [Oscillospiraceae bacterium]